MSGVESIFSDELNRLKSFMEAHFEQQESMLKDLTVQVQSALQPGNVDLDTQNLKFLAAIPEDHPSPDSFAKDRHTESPGSDDPNSQALQGVGSEDSDSKQGEQADGSGRAAAMTRKSSLQSLDSTDTFVSDFLHRSERKAHEAASRLTQLRFHSELSNTGIMDMSSCRAMARRIVNSTLFVYAVTFVIVFNLVILGIEVDVSTQLGQNDIPNWFGICNGVVVGLFSMELGINLYAQGCGNFFCGRERWWNLFDLLIIILSLLESSLDFWVAATTQAGQQQPVSPSHLRFARSIRLARALRGIRVMRLLRYVSALRTLVLSILSSMASLMWTLVLLLLLFYSFGVLFTQLVTDECRIQAILATDEVNSVPECTNQYAYLWESIPQSMLTLFMAITGGIDWIEALRPLQEIGILAVFCMIMYMTITYFAIVNVITGVFVTTAMETTSADKELSVMKQLQTHQAQVEDLNSLFTEISGGQKEVSIEQLSTAMTIPRFKAFLQAMGISTEEVGVLFKLLDENANGLVEKEEFVKGCLNLQGNAKSVSLAKMSYENKLTRREIKQLKHSVSELSKITRMSLAKQDFLRV